MNIPHEYDERHVVFDEIVVESPDISWNSNVNLAFS